VPDAGPKFADRYRVFAATTVFLALNSTQHPKSSFPSVFKEGWLRLNKKVPFLSGADEVVSKFQEKKGALRGYICGYI